jgi:NADH-quinone oxidoreductase subunit M
MTIHLSILVFFPLVGAVFAALVPRVLLLATLVPLVYAVMILVDFDAAGGLQHVTDDAWIETLGIRYKLGVDGLNMWLILLTAVVAFASAVWLAVRQPERAGLFAFHFGLAETAVLARSWPRIWRSSSCSST